MSYLPCLNPNCHSHGKPHPNCRCYSGGESYAEGGSVCDRKIAHDAGCEYFKLGGPVGHADDFGAAMHHVGALKAHEGRSPEKHASNIKSGHSGVESQVKSLFIGGYGRPPEHDKASRDALDKSVEDGSIASPPDADLGNIDQDQATMLGVARGRIASHLGMLRPRPETSPRLAFDQPMEDSNKRRIYESALHVANNPSSVLGHVKAGTLEPDHVQHLGAMYPETAELYKKKITGGITQAQIDGESPDSHVRAGLSMLVGVPLSGEMTPALVQAAQAVFAAPVPQQAQGKGGGKPAGKTGQGNKKSLTNSDRSFLTQDQARQERGQKV